MERKAAESITEAEAYDGENLEDVPF